MKTTLLLISILTLLSFTLASKADEQETDKSPSTINSTTNSSLGVRTDFVTNNDGSSYVCITVPSSTGWSQTSCF